MQKTVQWALDTCDCVLEQQYDDGDYSGTMKITRQVRTCADHAGMDPATIPATAVDQMKRKNLLYARLKENFPDADFTWAFTGVRGDRTLTITTAGLTALQQTALQTWATTRFGAGKVVVL